MAGTKWYGLLAVGALVVPAAARVQSSRPAVLPETLYFVSASGSDASGAANDPTRPYRSPAGAFRGIPRDITRGPGDHVIEITDDAVYGQVHLSGRTTDATHRIVLRPAPGRHPTLDADSRADGSPGEGTNNPAILVHSDHVVIQGLHLTNTSLDPSLGPGGGSEVMVRLEGSHSVIEGNFFDGGGRVPTITDMFLLICNTASDNLIVGNRFDYSGGKGLIHVTASCGSGSPGRQVIRNNALSRFGNNPQAICGGINFGGQPGTFAGNNSVVENNTIHDNGGGCYGLANTNGSTLTVRNNIFSKITGHRSAIGCNQATGWSTGVAYHSLMFGNTRDVETACWSLSGTTYADPLFMDPGASPPDLRTRSPAASEADGWRTISFETSQVTAPDVAVSPDGQWLVFTMLGKLFRLPVKGGEAEQLTFGPYYDVEPAFSPDGEVVAFHSDRDGSAGNIFLLDVASRKITQLTHEIWADRPAWTPDGRAVVYLQLERSAWNPVDSIGRGPSTIRRQALAGGPPETVQPLARYYSAFHLSDRRLAWSVVERDSASRRITARVEALNPDGNVVLLRQFDGGADPVVVSPKGDGLYVRHARWDVPPPEPELQFVPLGDGPARRLGPISNQRRFAVAPDGSGIYAGSLGSLWKLRLPGGSREAIPLHARVTLAIREPTRPPKWTPVETGTIGSARTIHQVRLSPDGSLLVFRALNRLWKQPLSGDRPAVRLVADSIGGEREPAFSPDGKQLAFVRAAAGREEIQVLNLHSGLSHSFAPDSACGFEYLVWRVQTELIGACDGRLPHPLIAIDPFTGAMREILRLSGWEPHPQVSADGRTIYFQADFPESRPGFYRLDRNAGKPELMFQFPAGSDEYARPMHGAWIALPIQNRPGIRLARLGAAGTAPTRMRDIEEGGGTEMAFTPDGKSLLYVVGNRLWREPLEGGPRKEIPIRLSLQAPVPAPVLIRRVMVLDFATGGFGAETSLLLEGGRIRWIGSGDGRTLPPGTVTVDGGGRFAIPGLFEMHGHGNGCGGVARIAHGVTSVRNMGGRLERQNVAADRSDYSSDAVARCFYAGRILEGPSGASRNEDWFFIHVKDEADLRAQVRALKSEGAQFIKLYNWVPWPLQRAAIDEAGRLGLPVAAHGNNLEQVVKGITLGFAELTHLLNPFHDDAFQLIAAAGTRWEPTVGIGGGYAVHFRDDPQRFRRANRGDERLSDQRLRGRYAENLRTLAAAYRRGVVVMPGTDSGPEGLALQWELEFFAEAGIPAVDILRLATLEAARSVGASADLGSLEAGKLADLVLLDANPLDNIRNTQKIWRVFKGGWMFDPKVLLPGGN